MAAAIRIPNRDQIRNQAHHVLNNLSNRFHHAFERARPTLNAVGNAYRTLSYGLRQEVPFERWFYDHGFQTPIENTQDLIKARAWAILATLEGSIKVAAEAVSFAFEMALVSGNRSSALSGHFQHHSEVLNAQWQGLSLSLLAIASPNQAKEKANNAGGSGPLIGASILDWKWGTLYNGKLDVPLWHIECRQYPWADHPAE